MDRSPDRRYVIFAYADTLLLLTGLIDSAGESSESTKPTDTETVIQNDPDLTSEERDALLRVYRSFRHHEPSG